MVLGGNGCFLDELKACFVYDASFKTHVCYLGTILWRLMGTISQGLRTSLKLAEI